ncbi:glutathione S-transferase family protein [Thetidibacter halocola]|uniref:Glutathione S-transferase family protein n=1 Tax=Thetidibacter halocola TaxID=2827239 RepID=A0A8J7WH04_9RHOB|nr:glutathione S-transferase family protein [Thetidibacter halocola]MBS0125511.1 glutathione S-transferase family protein [Thetidibacter halocola]
MSYTVYGTVNSRAFRVLWMLEELGQPYELVKAGPQSPEIRAVSPLGKVPVLVVDGVVIPDSMAILAFLADRHGAMTYPAGTVERARQDAWSYRILDEIESLLWTASKHTFVLPEDERVPDVKPACRAEYERNLTRIMAEAEGPFLMGETMTVPDILLAHCGGWARAAKFPDGPEAFGDYLKRLRGREAFKAAAAR